MSTSTSALQQGVDTLSHLHYRPDAPSLINQVGPALSDSKVTTRSYETICNCPSSKLFPPETNQENHLHYWPDAPSPHQPGRACTAGLGCLTQVLRNKLQLSELEVTTKIKSKDPPALPAQRTSPHQSGRACTVGFQSHTRVLSNKLLHQLINQVRHWSLVCIPGLSVGSFWHGVAARACTQLFQKQAAFDLAQNELSDSEAYRKPLC